MPMRAAEQFGTNADGSRNDEYCCHCYQGGAFTDPDRTLEQMIEKVAGFMVSEFKMAEAEARPAAEEFLSKLKRWQNPV